MFGWCGGDEGAVSMGEGVCIFEEVRGLLGWGSNGGGEFDSGGALGLPALPGPILGVDGADPGRDRMTDL